jgi:hypothetical protein
VATYIPNEEKEQFGQFMMQVFLIVATTFDDA